jgi:pyruvate-formate lyase-activating enzyme
MPSFDTLEPAIDPNNKIGFLLDWELTMKCNLDCSYCATGLHGGHDNSTKHPPLDECLASVDFMLEYVDLYMQHRPKGIQSVVLNVYGGESLHHPDIVKILAYVRQRYQQYQSRWQLTVTTTTNAIISTRKLLEIVPFIDEFTVSYHAEATSRQQQQFKDNVITISEMGKRVKCVVLMHNQETYFNDGTDMIDWLTINNIKMLPRQLDSLPNQRTYNQTQIKWFNNLYKSKTFGTATDINEKENTDLGDTGRACCGGRQVCENQDYRERKFYVLDNKFTNWYCSVNWFFLFVKQVNGEVYVNKDCKMNFDGQVGPIGTLKNTKDILSKLTTQLASNSVPVIQCKKNKCMCGLCAPKAKELDTYTKIMKKYQKDYQS